MKKIWQLVFNDFLSNVAIQSFDVYTIWYIAQITKDQRLVALFGSVGIINVLLLPIGGVFADNYPRDKIIKVTSVIRSFGFLVFLIFVLVLHDIRYLVVSLSFLLSLLGAFYTPAIQAIVPNISQTDDELFSNNTYVSTANQLASITGAGVGGILIMIVRPRLVYLMITILIIMATLFIMFFKMTIPQKLNHHSSILTVLNLKASWHNIQKVFKFPIVKILFPYACLLNLSFWLFYYLMPMYLNKQFKHYTFAYSLQELMIAIAAFICGLIMTKFSDYFLQHAYWYTIYLVLQAVGIVFMSLLFMIITNEFIKLMILIIAWLFYGIFNFLSSLIFITKVQQQVDNRHLGITFGIIFSIFSALGPISAALSGFIKQPNSQTVFGIGSLMLIVALVMLFDKRVAKLISFN